MSGSGDDGNSMSFLAHLDALRSALFWIGGILIVLFVPGMIFSDWLLDQLIRFGAPGLELQYFSPLEPFIVQLKIAFFAALLAGAPLVWWRIWRFVAPGLYREEQRVVLRLTVVTSLLFIAGAAIALFFMIPLMMKFSFSFQTQQLRQMIGLQQYVAMAGWLMLGFGVMFQFPVAIYLLAAGGIVEVATLRRQRPIIVVVILILAAILTPPDVISQIVLGVPAWLMFEISLILAAAKLKRKRREPETEEMFRDDDETGTVSSPAAPPSADPDDMDESFPDFRGGGRYHRPYGEEKRTRRLRFVGGGGKHGRHHKF